MRWRPLCDPRQGSNKRGISREKPEKAKPPGTKSVTQKRTRRRGQVKKATKATKATNAKATNAKAAKAKVAKVAKKANGRKRGAR